MSDQEDESIAPATSTKADDDTVMVSTTGDDGEDAEASSSEDDEDEPEPLTPAQKRAAALDMEKREEEAKSSMNMRRYVDIFGIMFLMVGMAWPIIFGDGRDKPPKLGVVELDQSFYKTVPTLSFNDSVFALPTSIVATRSFFDAMLFSRPRSI
jgi:hypothetical protein